MERETLKVLFQYSTAQVFNVSPLGNLAHIQPVVEFLPDTLQHVMIDRCKENTTLHHYKDQLVNAV
jgi:hypothetical protein